MTSFFKSHCYWPFVFFVLLFFGILTCYGISVTSHHVPSLPEWPFVSDTGVATPERCIFTLLFSMAAFACLVTMYLYYKYVIHQHHQTKTNKAALVVGCVVCFGMVMVGAFQWTVVLVPHMIGAFLACGGATLYSWLIVHISRRQLAPTVHGMGVVYCRMVIALVESIAATVFLVALVLWKVNEKYRSFAAIAEWILIYGAILFLLTLVYDLRRIKDTSLDLILHSDYTVTSPVSAKEDDRLNEVSVT